MEISRRQLVFTSIYDFLSYLNTMIGRILIICQIRSSLQLCVFDVPCPDGMVDIVLAVFNSDKDHCMIGSASLGIMLNDNITYFRLFYFPEIPFLRILDKVFAV